MDESGRSIESKSNPGSKDPTPAAIARASIAGWCFGLFIALATLVVFWPTLGNGFVNWDDPGMVLGNPHITGLGASHLWWMATTFHMGPYQPLAWLSLAIDYALWGLDPFGYHLTSLLWHVANALSLYVLARYFYTRFAAPATDRAVPVAACAALAGLLFAVHPLRVQPVAWVSDRLDVIAAFFGIWTVWAYLKAVPLDRTGQLSKGYFRFSLVAFVVSLLCKSSTVLLPAVLSVLDVYPIGRLDLSRSGRQSENNGRVWIEKWPYWLISGIAGVVTIAGRLRARSLAPVSAYGPIDRVVIACFNAVFYLWKTAAPTNLSPLYELPDQIDAASLRFVGSAAVVFVVTGWLAWQHRRFPSAAAVWFSYGLLLLPVSGLFQTGAQLAADRYSYIPSLALSIFVGAVLLRWLCGTRLAAPGPRLVTMGTALACVVLLGLLSWRQCFVWRDSDTLWRHALRVDPRSCTAHTNLACNLIDADQFAVARELLEQAVEIRPRSHSAHSNLGALLSRTNERDLAIRHYLEAAKWSPPSAEISAALGSLYQLQGNLRESAVWFEKALVIEPKSGTTLVNLGIVYSQAGEVNRAMTMFDRAVRVDPQNANAHNNFGIALRRAGRIDQALKEYMEAWRLDPQSAEVAYNVGHLYLGRGDWGASSEWYERALGLEPSHVKALNDLGIVRRKTGKVAEAIALYERALELTPENTEVRCNLALARAGQGDDQGAIDDYRRVLELDASNSVAADSVAVLLERRGEFAEAVQWLRGAMPRAETAPNPRLLYRLAWILATATDDEVRNGPEAVGLAEQLVRLVGGDRPDVLDVQAASYAETGRFNEARDLAARAVRLAKTQNDTDLADAIERRAALYESGQAYRQ
jgi:tetratricopeptide (TPR) repeat protein